MFETEHTRTHCPIHQTAHTDACKSTPYCIYSCLPEDETMRFETCRRHNKLNINLENCAYPLFLLHTCITIYGAKNEIKIDGKKYDGGLWNECIWLRIDERYQASRNMLLSFRMPYNVGDFLTSWTTISFTMDALLYRSSSCM